MGARKLADETALAASSNSGLIPVQDPDRVTTLHMLLAVSAAGGTTPTLDVSVEWTHDDGTTYVAPSPADAFTQATGITAEFKSFTVLGPAYRLVYTVGGTTPTFDFEVTVHGT